MSDYEPERALTIALGVVLAVLIAWCAYNVYKFYQTTQTVLALAS